MASGREVDALPQLFWSDGKPWREANLWLHERATSRGTNIRTVQTIASSVHAYAVWLEEAGTTWWEFPARKGDRCLVRYRGALIDARDQGLVAPSTATQRMRDVIRFYRWLRETGMLLPSNPMWKDRTVHLQIASSTGFERTILVNTTDLAIPNRAAPGERLEDGLLPLSPSDRDAALAFAQLHASEELFLLLTLGFFTGMRLGTLTDLKIQTLTNAVPEPLTPDLFRLAVGPQSDPPVATKFGVNGQVWITRAHLERLLEYGSSVRRLKREARAAPSSKDLLFLTRFGNPYARRGSDKSVALNVEMHAFRRSAKASGSVPWASFRFHQTRCTFATELAKIAMKFGGAINAVAIVKEALLHKHEATSLRYIKFLEKTRVKEEAANIFTREFLGLLAARESKE